MTAICEADVEAVLGATGALVLRELVRTKATAAELARAVDFGRAAGGGYPFDLEIRVLVHFTDD